MAKLVLTDVSSGYSTVTALNANNDAIEAALENTLSRDGTGPNQMGAQLDMNSNAITNLPDAVNNQSPVTLSQAATIAGVTNPITAETVGAVLYPQTAQELASSLTPTNFYKEPGNVLRYGITGNDAGAATANTTAIRTLCSNTVAGGYTGRVYFPKDTYYFNDRIPCRDGLHFDLCGSTLNFTKTGSTDDTDGGFFHALRDFSLRNGTIVTNYTYVAGTNTANAVALGGRSTANVDFDVYDDEEPAPLGNIVIDRIDFDMTGGENSAAMLAFGGLQNCRFTNITVKGNSTLQRAFNYEFGWATSEAAAADRQTSHMHNCYFGNWIIEDLDDTSSLDIGLRFGGAYQVVLENIHVRGCNAGIQFTPGEALFYRVWDPDNITAKRPTITMRNITMSEIEGTAILVTGASGNTGYLSGVSIPDQNLVDLYNFSLDTFSLIGGENSTTMTAGVNTSAGFSDIRNGYIQEANNAIIATDEAVNLHIHNVEARDSTSIGFRLNFGTPIFSTERKKTGVVEGCKIVGGASNAITIDHCHNFIFRYNRFGYETATDGVAETTQTAAINVGSDGFIICDSNYVAGVASGNAYTGGSGTAWLINPMGVRTASDEYAINGNFVQPIGDTNTTLTAGSSALTTHYSTTLTANRTVVLSTTGAIEGDTFKVIRTGLGAFTLDVGGLKTVPSATAATVDVVYDGAAWVLAGYGAL